jgi:GNAT superfamily N-acetyltransferase
VFVRLALETDEDAYVELGRMAVDLSARHIGFKEEKVRALFHRYLDRASPTITVVEDRGEIIGFLNATISDYEFADGIYTTQEILFVRPDRRGTRAAALLLSEFTRWSDQLGALENTGGNDNAINTEQTTKFLKRFGFEQVGSFMRRIRGAEGGKEGRKL